MDNNTINTKGLNINAIIQYIDDYHDGNILYLISYIDSAIYMLHFLNDDYFTPYEVRSTCSAIRGLRECLMEAHLKQQGWPYYTSM